jgi:hypothetical protein
MYWMADRPRLLPLLLKEQLRLSLEHGLVIDSSEASTGVAGHVFKFALIFDSLPTEARRFLTFDPFGTELFVSRGGSAIRFFVSSSLSVVSGYSEEPLTTDH